MTITQDGTTTFQARAVDAAGNVGQSDSITITTTTPSQTPSARSASIITLADTSVAITLEADDPAGEALTYSLTQLPELGALSGFDPTTGDVTYTPNPGVTGEDTFQFTASNDTSTSQAATITIQINERLTGPVATDLAIELDEDEDAQVTLQATTDQEGELTFELLTSPNHGTITAFDPVTGALTYTPEQDFNGEDAFTYRAGDGTLDSAPATVTLHITPVNDPPETEDLEVVTDEDTPLPITVPATDVDGDTLTYEIATAPSNGTLSGELPDLTYTPDPDYYGDDTFTVAISDGRETVHATITITVDPVNDPPVAIITVKTTSGAAPFQVTLDASTSYDIDSEDLSYYWSFGDGESATGPTPTHVFTDPGRYEVTLTVIDAEMATTQSTQTLTANGLIRLDDPQHARTDHTATLLDDGRVLIVGGDNDGTAEIYDPATQSFTLTGSLSTQKSRHAAVKLSNGHVLVLGGSSATFEDYAPATGTFTTVHTASFPVVDAFLEPDGRILIFTERFSCSGEGKILRYDPTAKTLSELANLGPTSGYSVTKTLTGTYLLTGGTIWSGCSGNPTASIQAFDPETGALGTVGSMRIARSSHDSLLLPDGRALILGGFSGTELFDPVTATSTRSSAGGLRRDYVVLEALIDGRVLVSSRVLEDGPATTDALQIYDPVADTLSPAGTYDKDRYGHTLVSLDSGDVLIVGGRSNMVVAPQDAYLWLK